MSETGDHQSACSHLSSDLCYILAQRFYLLFCVMGFDVEEHHKTLFHTLYSEHVGWTWRSLTRVVVMQFLGLTARDSI